ncbi:glycosyltransferase involved in cell wall biosynthesis [Rubricella aquisinus]|uniref:Glycosyltransferase involved in cell wall biosynthesis n=1 Tax=Rubricella aquisinus TaxID=2028108 RepID=A0A840WH06_9RHOB|nr:glycosyltransferase [Rubricella aquisinus]MBB5514398.1 glycosyltransferase involved in cell wall biosynthesis [Rubricella aquisinus]
MRRPILLDITRSLQRQARGAATGIDRVEAAYSAALEAHYLYQSARLWAVLDADGLSRLRAETPQLDLKAHLTPWRDRSRRQIEAALRRHAVWYGAGSDGLTLPAGTAWHYINVGHTSPLADDLSRMRARGVAQITVMIHDVIPILYPHWCDAGAAARFAARLRAVAAHADRMLYVSQPARGEVEAIMSAWGDVLDGHVIPPGIDVPPITRVPERGRFLMLGTVEPRKNLSLLLDIWPDLAAEGAVLDVVGHAGWGSAPLVSRCRATPGVTYHGALPDAEVHALLARADALLFPSLAEGAGLPVGEALGIGLPVIAHDLPCLKDLFGEAPHYVSAQNPAEWADALRSRFREHSATKPAYEASKLEMPLPTWQTHFNVLERLLE